MRRPFALAAVIVVNVAAPAAAFLALSPSFARHKSSKPKRPVSSLVSCESHMPPSFLLRTSATAIQDTISVLEDQNRTIIGTAILLLPSRGASVTASKFGSQSPVENPSLVDAASHLANKAKWFSEGSVLVEIMYIPENGEGDQDSLARLNEVDALIALGLSAESDLEFCSHVFNNRRRRDLTKKGRQCQFALGCGTVLPSTVGPFDEVSPSLQANTLPWTHDAAALRLHNQMVHLFDRWNTDDFTVAMMLFFNQFSGSEVDWVKHSIDATWEKGPVRNAQEFYSMISNCGDCIVKCLGDEKCKKCIDALTKVDTRDQVASYRTIVSFESELLKDFSFCILQKNNIFNCDAKIPSMPKVKPISVWRGQALTFETARSILVGHLNDDDAPEGGRKLEVSWKVAAGANVAYDQFPSQNQLFYVGVNGRDMWYDPVFRVETIDGRNVWCKRHYKVRDGPTPGTFRLSVLDNGVTSNEFWTIAGVADDLSWIVFQYAGAAGAVGQRYIGGLLCTPDGSLPSKEDEDAIWSTFRSVGLQPWELFPVDNDPATPGAVDAGPPPLRHFRDSVIAAKAKKASAA